MKGTVKRFYFRKGFGFIEGDQGTEYFFHYSDFTGAKDSLRPGLAVDFQPQQGDKGPCALAVVAHGGRSGPAAGARAPVREPTAVQRRALGPFVAGFIVGLLLGAGTVLLLRL